MRMTQIMGLSPRAHQFIIDNRMIVQEKCSCPHCVTPHVDVEVNKEIGDASHYGMFDDGPKLLGYQLKDGSWVNEYVQECQWSSGPMIFLSLEGHPELDWTEEEMR